MASEMRLGRLNLTRFRVYNPRSMISFRTFEVFNMITNQPFISQIRVNDKPTLSYSFLASLSFHHSVTSASIHLWQTTTTALEHHHDRQLRWLHRESTANPRLGRPITANPRIRDLQAMMFKIAQLTPIALSSLQGREYHAFFELVLDSFLTDHSS
jgi:hypothetical protein